MVALVSLLPDPMNPHPREADFRALIRAALLVDIPLRPRPSERGPRFAESLPPRSATCDGNRLCRSGAGRSEAVFRGKANLHPSAPPGQRRIRGFVKK